jgi:hypothetical protein
MSRVNSLTSLPLKSGGCIILDVLHFFISKPYRTFFSSLQSKEFNLARLRFLCLIHISPTKMAGNPCFALLWIILLFIAWPVAAIAVGLWITLQPFEAVFDCFKDCNGCLETYVTWPRQVGQAISDCDSSCPAP